MTAEERNILVSYAYEYIANLGEESYDEYINGESIDVFVQKGNDTYRLIRALGRSDQLDYKDEESIISCLMKKVGLEELPQSALFDLPESVQYRTRYIYDEPQGGAAETDPTVPTHVKSITTQDILNWDDAYSWGDHALAGYLTSESDPTVPSHVKSITITDISNWDTAYGWGNHATYGYITSESDPTVPSHVKSITTDDISNWDEVFTNGITGFTLIGTGQNVIAGAISNFPNAGKNALVKGILAGSTKVSVATVGGTDIVIDINEGNIDHDSLTGVVANEHIDHTTVSVSAGLGLSGGGTIEQNRTINLDHLGIQNLVDPNSSGLVIGWNDTTNQVEWVSGSGAIWGTITGTLSNQIDLQGALDTKENVFGKNTAFNKNFAGNGVADTVARSDHDHLLAVGATDVTATAAEVNLLDLAGLTAGWVLSADTATTASWKQLSATSVAAAGSDTQFQYNNGGVFGGASALVYDDVNNWVGIGITAPDDLFHVSADGASRNASLERPTTNVLFSNSGTFFEQTFIVASDLDSHRPIVHFSRARGTVDTPLTLISGDKLATINASGYDGTGLNAFASIDFIVDGAVSTGTVPMSIEFQTGSTTRTTNMTVQSDGDISMVNNVGIGGGGATPTGLIETLRVSVVDSSTMSSSLLTSVDALTVINSDTTGLNVISVGNGVQDRPTFSGARARGTLAIPTAPVVDDEAFTLISRIYDGVAMQATADIVMYVDGAVSSGVAPQRISFRTSSTNSTGRAERFVIKNDGKIWISALPDDGDASDVLLLRDGTNGEITKLGIGTYLTVSAGNLTVTGLSPTSHTHLLAAGATDVTATAAEVNLLDLAGLTAGWVLAANTATTASWRQLLGSEINNDLGWITGTYDNYVSWTAAADTGSDAVTAGQTLTIAGGTNVTTTLVGTTITIDATGSGTIGGSIASTQIAYGTAANTIGGEAAFTYNATTNTLTVDNIEINNVGVGTNPVLSSNDATQTTDVTGGFTATGRLRATGNILPATGIGVEIGYTEPNGVVVAYDRGTASYKNLRINGATLEFEIGGTDAVVIDASSYVNIKTTPAVADGADELLLRDGTSGAVTKLGIGTGLSVSGGDLTSGGGAGASSDTEILYNNGGTLDGMSDFVYDDVNNKWQMRGASTSTPWTFHYQVGGFGDGYRDGAFFGEANGDYGILLQHGPSSLVGEVPNIVGYIGPASTDGMNIRGYLPTVASDTGGGTDVMQFIVARYATTLYESLTNRNCFAFDNWDDRLFELNISSAYLKYPLTVAENAVPGTPATGEFVLYAKTDGKFYGKNDAGTEYDLTAVGGGSEWTVKSSDIYRNSQVGIGNFSTNTIDSKLHVRDDALNAGIRYQSGTEYTDLTDYGLQTNRSDSYIRNAFNNGRLFLGQNATGAQGYVTIDGQGTAGLVWVGINHTLPSATLDVEDDTQGVLGLFNGSGYAGGNTVIRLLGSTANDAGVQFGDSVDPNYGRIMYDLTAHEMQFWINNAERMTLDANQMTMPAHLYITGAHDIFLQNAGYIYFGTTLNTDVLMGFDGTQFRVNMRAEGNIAFEDDGVDKFTFDLAGTGSGEATATDWIATSDRERKERFESYTQIEIDNIYSVGEKGTKYYWKEEFSNRRDKQYGHIAQDVEEYFPSLVKTEKDGSKSLSYGKLASLALVAVSDLNKRSKSQDGDIRFLIKEIQRLKKELNKVKSLLI